jgi:hypothetical protein
MEGKTSMVDDLEKSLENSRYQIPGYKASRRRKAKGTRRNIRSTFRFLSTNMQVRVTAQLLFEAFNA